jgi:farnesyl diphosphate synthase
MTFAAALKSAAAEIDVFLDRLLRLRGAEAGCLIAAMRYAALGQGKRLRPFLTLECARLFDVPREWALRAGAAIECVHCYSLVHDDLPAMDDDDVRRGRPTVHKAFNEATAILTGDSLLTCAFEILSDRATHPDADIRCNLVAGLASAAGKNGMVAGQMLDLEAETVASPEIGHIVRIQSLKTGALFGFACEAGAILGGADRRPLRDYARHIGLAFQIADDILDVEASSASLGKAAQKDRGRGKATFVEPLGLEGAKAKAQSLVDEAKRCLACYGDRAERLREAADFIISREK